jgi:hypothetical protein
MAGDGGGGGGGGDGTWALHSTFATVQGAPPQVRHSEGGDTAGTHSEGETLPGHTVRERHCRDTQ